MKFTNRKISKNPFVPQLFRLNLGSTLILHLYKTCHLHEDNKEERYEHKTYRSNDFNSNRRHVDFTYHLHESNFMHIKFSYIYI